MSLIKKILLPIFSIFVLILLVMNRMVPTGDLWKGYTLLYVPVETEDSVVKVAFEKSNIGDVVSLENQDKFLPIAVREDTPESALSFISANDKKSVEYLTRRINYFYDKSKDFKIYYIPSKYKNNVKSCVSFLSKNHIDSGIDSKAVYPWILPVLSIFVLGVLFYFAKNKLLYLGTSLFPLFYIFTNPFYPSAICTTFTFLLIFCCTNIWKRDGAIDILRKNYILLAIAAVAILSAFASSILSGLYYILSIFALVSFLFFYDDIEEFFLTRKAFRFVYIRPAKMISLFSGKTKSVIGVMLACQIIIVAAFFASSTQIVSNHFAKILLPTANVGSFERDDALPKLDEYYRWNWRILTYPYVSLNSEYEEECTDIIYPRYQDVNGKIEKIENHIYYDNNFIEDINSNIDLLEFDSIEKVLKNQNSNLNPGFSSVKSNPINIFGIIMMIVSLCLLLFIYFSIIIKATKSGGRK